MRNFRERGKKIIAPMPENPNADFNLAFDKIRKAAPSSKKVKRVNKAINTRFDVKFSKKTAPKA